MRVLVRVLIRVMVMMRVRVRVESEAGDGHAVLTRFPQILNIFFYIVFVDIMLMIQMYLCILMINTLL